MAEPKQFYRMDGYTRKEAIYPLSDGATTESHSTVDESTLAMNLALGGHVTTRGGKIKINHLRRSEVNMTWAQKIVARIGYYAVAPFGDKDYTVFTPIPDDEVTDYHREKFADSLSMTYDPVTKQLFINEPEASSA